MEEEESELVCVLVSEKCETVGVVVNEMEVEVVKVFDDNDRLDD